VNVKSYFWWNKIFNL